MLRLAAAGLLATALLGPTLPFAHAGGVLQYHPPILVAGDAEFLLPTSGVGGGSGTPEDPYVIQGWVLMPFNPLTTGDADNGCSFLPLPVPFANQGMAHALEIRDTTAHVVIRNNLFRPLDPRGPFVEERVLAQVGDSRWLSAIFLHNVQNVTIEANTFQGTFRGICVTQDLPGPAPLVAHPGGGPRSLNLVIAGNRIERTGVDPVKVIKADGVTITKNVIDTSGGVPNVALPRGVFAMDVTGLVVSHNVVTHHWNGVVLLAAGRAVVDHNELSNNRDGLGYRQSDFVTVTKNVITRNGIGVLGRFPSVVHDNNIHGNGAGVVNAPQDVLDAENNWWGCSTGPNTPGCDGVSSRIDFDPWRSSPVPDAGP